MPCLYGNTGGSGNVNNVNDAGDLLSAVDIGNLGGFMNYALDFRHSKTYLSNTNRSLIAAR